MKNKLRGLAILSIFLGASGLNVFALPFIGTNTAVVTIQATSPLASEPGNNPAVFTVYRSGNTNSALTLDLAIGGTAKNGVDYAAISNAVSLAAGQTSAEILITPVNEPSATGFKKVVLTIKRAYLFRHAEPAYFVGSFGPAVAYIAYNYTNVPPSVSLLAPTNGSSYFSRPNITLAAKAVDSNGWVKTVEFLANGSSVGIVSNSAPAVPLGKIRDDVFLPWNNNRYQLVWTNVAPGNYSLTAVATDNAGLQTASPAIDITVTTNLAAPVVRIASPTEGAEFPGNAPINIYAAASETNGVVHTVEFLANGTNVGVATNYVATHPYMHSDWQMQWVPYSFRWTNPPVGTNILTAIATDNNGITATSSPVSVIVTTNKLRFHPWPWR
jgi:hypothetical protein